MPTLRRMTRQTRAALTARRNRAHEHAVAYVVSRNTFAKLFDHANRLMPDHQTRCNGIFTSHDMKVRSANRCQRHANDGFADSSAWFINFLDLDFVLATKNICFHFTTSLLYQPCASTSMQCLRETLRRFRRCMMFHFH